MTTTDLPDAPPRDDDADAESFRSMDDELRKRREQTWEMLIVQGRDYREVCELLATEYDVSESAIEKDIERMDNWLPKLNHLTSKSGASRLRELRHNRQRRRELLDEVRADEDADRKDELRLLDNIDKALAMDVKLSQSLGETEREPQEHVTKHEGAVTHELTDSQRENIDQLREWADGQVPKRDDAIEVENLEEAEDDDASETGS